MTDALRPILDVDVSRETHEKLKHFTTLLEKWTQSINLIAPKTIPDIWNRHIVDSAQLFTLPKKDWTSWTDLGSGGGLPAVVIAILDQEKRPITLVESDQRKCLFLRTVKRELSLNMVVENRRIENANLGSASVLTARALAPLSELLNYSADILQAGDTAFFSKGESFQSELDEARKNWQFDLKTHISRTNPNARILEISRISRREP